MYEATRQRTIILLKNLFDSEIYISRLSSKIYEKNIYIYLDNLHVKWRFSNVCYVTYVIFVPAGEKKRDINLIEMMWLNSKWC